MRFDAATEGDAGWGTHERPALHCAPLELVGAVYGVAGTPIGARPRPTARPRAGGSGWAGSRASGAVNRPDDTHARNDTL
jgi:hypothetical protein